MAISTIRAIATDSDQNFRLFLSKYNKKDRIIQVYDRTAEAIEQTPSGVEDALYHAINKNSILVASYEICANEQDRYDLYDIERCLRLKINTRTQQHLAEYGLYHYLGLHGMYIKKIV